MVAHLMSKRFTNIFQSQDNVRCQCESKNGDGEVKGIVCEKNGTIEKIGSCNSNEWCTGNVTENYSTRRSQFCAKGNHTPIIWK